MGVPLGAITVAGVLLSLYVSDWSQEIETDLTSPFSLRNALAFGALFLTILVISAGAEALFGTRGFLTTTFLAGLISSGTATATAVTLVATDQISNELADAGILAGTLASILVKVFFAATIDRDLVKPVFLWSAILISVGIVFGFLVIFAP